MDSQNTTIGNIPVPEGRRNKRRRGVLIGLAAGLAAGLAGFGTAAIFIGGHGDAGTVTANNPGSLVTVSNATTVASGYFGLPITVTPKFSVANTIPAPIKIDSITLTGMNSNESSCDTALAGLSPADLTDHADLAVGKVTGVADDSSATKPGDSLIGAQIGPSTDDTVSGNLVVTLTDDDGALDACLDKPINVTVAVTASVA